MDRTGSLCRCHYCLGCHELRSGVFTFQLSFSHHFLSSTIFFLHNCNFTAYKKKLSIKTNLGFILQLFRLNSAYTWFRLQLFSSCSENPHAIALKLSISIATGVRCAVLLVRKQMQSKPSVSTIQPFPAEDFVSEWMFQGKKKRKTGWCHLGSVTTATGAAGYFSQSLLPIMHLPTCHGDPNHEPFSARFILTL